MKNRLQRLWDEAVPLGGSAPGPDPKTVLGKVDAVLDGGKPHRRRIPRRAVLLAAAVLLLTAFSVAANRGELPLHNVIDAHFPDSQDRALAESMMDAAPLMVSDDNYIMTVTSSIADKNNVYLTLNVKAKNEEAKARMQSGEPHALLEFKTSAFGDSSGSEGSGYDPETGVYESVVKRQLLPWPFSRSISVRCVLMEEELWLKVPVHPISSVKLKVNATAPGGPSQYCRSGGPVTVQKIVLSPMSAFVKFISPTEETGEPVLYFLWKDGAVSTQGQMGATGYSGSATHGETEFSAKYTYKFDGIQDLTKMEAVIFGGMAYPLDGGAPYAYDTSGLPTPFWVPAREDDHAGFLVPLSQVCRGLGVPENLDVGQGTASVTYRGITVHYMAGRGAELRDAETGETLAQWDDETVLLQDSELWVSYVPLLSSMKIGMRPVWGHDTPSGMIILP